jgi:hypothetical protein
MLLLAWTLVTCGVTAWVCYVAGVRHGREEAMERVERARRWERVSW